MQDQDTESKSLNVGRDILNCRRSRKTTNMLSVHHYQPCSNNSPNTYERCQVSFGRFIVDFIRWFLGCWQAFLTAPLTRRESEAMGGRSEKSAGCLNVGLWNVSTSKDWAYG